MYSLDMLEPLIVDAFGRLHEFPGQKGPDLLTPPLGAPASRRLQIFVVGPSLAGDADPSALSRTPRRVRWEILEPGPVGEYLEVEDVDAVSGRRDAVDLDDPRLVAVDGWAPLESNPQFHQQMAYAVAMRTVEHFERAVGHPVLWRSRSAGDDDDRRFTRRLRIRPLASTVAGAHYGPSDVALHLGRMEGGAAGLREASAEIVAITQRFAIPEIVEAEIGRTHSQEMIGQLLGRLAVQVGPAGIRGRIRDAIGRSRSGAWEMLDPRATDLSNRHTARARGAVLLAAVFDAFLAICRVRVAGLVPPSTSGASVESSGRMHPDVARRVSGEVATSATRVMDTCIRAPDYLPPVDGGFAEFLRALIPADREIVADDRNDFRGTFVEAFRRRGIVSFGAAPDTMVWVSEEASTPLGEFGSQYAQLLAQLMRFADASSHQWEREQLFRTRCEYRRRLHGLLSQAFAAAPEFGARFGIDPSMPFAVRDLRRVAYSAPGGRSVPRIIVRLLQSTEIARDGRNGPPAFPFYGGATLVMDPSIPEPRYRIVKNIFSASRRARTASFLSHAQEIEPNVGSDPRS